MGSRQWLKLRLKQRGPNPSPTIDHFLGTLIDSAAEASEYLKL